jgi:WD40 repeat protein
MRWSRDGAYLAVAGGSDTGAVVRLWSVCMWPPPAPSHPHPAAHTPSPPGSVGTTSLGAGGEGGGPSANPSGPTTRGAPGRRRADSGDDGTSSGGGGSSVGGEGGGSGGGASRPPTPALRPAPWPPVAPPPLPPAGTSAAAHGVVPSSYVPGALTAAAQAAAAAIAQPPGLTTHGRSFFEPSPTREWLGHEAQVVDLAWSSTSLLLSAGMDGYLRLWHASRQECLHKFQHPDCVTAVAFHPTDDAVFLSGCFDRKLRLWSLESGRVSVWQTTASMVTAGAFSPDGRYAIAGLYSGTVVLFSTSEGLRFHRAIECRRTSALPAFVSPLAPPSSAPAGSGPGRKVTGLAFTPAGRHVAVTTNDSRVRLLSLDTCTLVYSYGGAVVDSLQIAASFDPSGARLVCGSEDGRVVLWRTRNDQHHPALNPRFTWERPSRVRSFESFTADEGGQTSRTAAGLSLSLAAAAEQVELGSGRYGGMAGGRAAVTVAAFAPASALGRARPPWAAHLWCESISEIGAHTAVADEGDVPPPPLPQGKGRGGGGAVGRGGTGAGATPQRPGTGTEGETSTVRSGGDGDSVTRGSASYVGGGRHASMAEGGEGVEEGGASVGGPPSSVGAGTTVGAGVGLSPTSPSTAEGGEGGGDTPVTTLEEWARPAPPAKPPTAGAARLAARLASHLVIVTADARGVLRVYENCGARETV